ncbi:hypothetical protein GCM10025793_23980 [Lysobacter lycopersici]
MFKFENEKHDPAQVAYEKLPVLEERAKKRFSEARALSPCGLDENRWILAAERKLKIQGAPIPQTEILIAPTFADIELLTFNSNRVYRYTFPQLTAFGPDFLESDKVEAKARRPIAIPGDEYERIVAAISRNTKYAMSSREYGHDGVVYYFKSGEDKCAFAWNPYEDAIGGHLTRISEILSKDPPVVRDINDELKALEDLERAY